MVKVRNFADFCAPLFADKYGDVELYPGGKKVGNKADFFLIEGNEIIAVRCRKRSSIASIDRVSEMLSMVDAAYVCFLKPSSMVEQDIVEVHAREKDVGVYYVKEDNELELGLEAIKSNRFEPSLKSFFLASLKAFTRGGRANA